MSFDGIALTRTVSQPAAQPVPAPVRRRYSAASGIFFSLLMALPLWALVAFFLR